MHLCAMLAPGVRYALLIVLGHSRQLWVRFYPRQDLRTLLYWMEACFSEWGVCRRNVFFDHRRDLARFIHDYLGRP